MSDYLLIESRDPFESHCHYYQELAVSLVESGSKVTLFLVENGVLPARICLQSSVLSKMALQGVEILVDEFSLRERGIFSGDLETGIAIAPLDNVIDMLVAGRKVLWH